ncbi:hypothetical protein I6M56_09410 [Shewanella algae]|uniref:flavodoxin family protein n=1 Tax=Shewanella algae TaxID=38313 RepID=UPI001AADCD0D|nr:hypothetical protein [Shewanella algae]MBO2679089.1 hypothetical protein [Shewanella algae]
MIRLFLMLLLAFALILFVVAFVVTRIENAQDAANHALRNHALKHDDFKHDTLKHRSAPEKPRNVAVVVFSRSGNTGVLADHIAETLDADVHELVANDYQLGMVGWINALNDARNDFADISPNHIDVSHYDTVYLGSPIWLYSPAPPIWQFANNTDFTNKHVVLVNTFNSQFKQHFIDEFEALVRSKGAISFAHQYVKRGRMGSQMSSQELIQRFDEKYNKKRINDRAGESDEQQ